MTTLREAAQQALWELGNVRDYIWLLNSGGIGCTEQEQLDELRRVIVVLKDVLAQPVQEPVAWMHTNGVGHVYFRKKPQDKVFNPVPLYTAIPQKGANE